MKRFDREAKVGDTLTAEVQWCLIEDEGTTRAVNLHDISTHVSGLPG